MDGGKQTRRPARLSIMIVAAVIGAVAWLAPPAPAAARVFVGIGVPFPGLYAPYPFYPPPYYYPPPAYYPPPPAAYYPPPAAAPGGAAPTAAAAPGAAAPTRAAATNITYTDRPAFKNAAGQTCREYRTSGGTFGTACQDGSGQWRVAN